jgi:pimeloyl-ACP methyl ester carboxylesterase
VRLRKALRAAAWIGAVLLGVGAAGLALTWQPDLPAAALETRWAAAPSQFIDVKGQRVHLRDEGPRDDPVPVLLIHGTSASLQTWDGWTAVLSKQRRVIRFDLPGFGLTGPNANGDYRDETLARFVIDLADVLRLERFVVGGNSLGGEVAWHTALLAPARVDRLILVDAAGYAFVPESVPIGFALARIPSLAWLAEISLPRRLVESSVRNVYGNPAAVTPELVERYFELTLRAGNRHALTQRLRQLQPGQDAARIRELALPTLILWGGRDRLIPPDSARRFAADIAGSELVMFETLGHVPHEEDPQATVLPVRRFLGLGS